MATTTTPVKSFWTVVSGGVLVSVILTIGGFGFAAKSASDGNAHDLHNEITNRTEMGRQLSGRMDREAEYRKQQFNDIKASLSEMKAQNSADMKEIRSLFIQVKEATKK
jgi:hypothetical protein